MNCHEMRNRKRNRKTSALPATSLINKREKCFFPNKKSRKNPKKKKKQPTRKKWKICTPYGGAACCTMLPAQYATICCTSGCLQQNKHNISRAHSIHINIKIRFESNLNLNSHLTCMHNSLQFGLLGGSKSSVDLIYNRPDHNWAQSIRRPVIADPIDWTRWAANLPVDPHPEYLGCISEYRVPIRSAGECTRLILFTNDRHNAVPLASLPFFRVPRSVWRVVIVL